MKIKLILSLILMIQLTCVYSQNTLTITSEQLKTTNLIFIEHEKLLKEIPLLKDKISNLKYINNSLIKQDSINKIQIKTATNIIEVQEKRITDLKAKNKRNKIITGGSILILILCLL